MDLILEGVPIRYGTAEPWKVIAQRIGRTKPSRAPQAQDKRRKKNDGRPPDTAKELLHVKKGRRANASKAATSTASSSGHRRHASYPWSKNSCLLDSSLELIFRAVSRDFAGFSMKMDGLHPKLSLATLFEALSLRRTFEISPGGTDDLSLLLFEQRDGLRDHLLSCRIISHTSAFSSAFVCDNTTCGLCIISETDWFLHL